MQKHKLPHPPAEIENMLFKWNGFIRIYILSFDTADLPLKLFRYYYYFF